MKSVTLSPKKIEALLSAINSYGIWNEMTHSPKANEDSEKMVLFMGFTNDAIDKIHDILGSHGNPKLVKYIDSSRGVPYGRN